MVVYVTLRMTLAGHTGLLPHQFYCCPRGHYITHIISPFLSPPTSDPLPPHPPHRHTYKPTPWRRGSTWPNTPAASDWLLKASNTPPCSPASETLLGNRGCAVTTTGHCCSTDLIPNPVLRDVPETKKNTI